MIKEGKQRIIITLDEKISKHLEVWINTSNYIDLKNAKSVIINEALQEWMERRGDTFGGWTNDTKIQN